MDLYIEFTRPLSGKCPFLSNLIRKFEKTPYSHVRLRWETGRKVPIVYEASGSQVSFLGDYAQTKQQVEVIHSFAIPLSLEQKQKLVDVAITYAGISYGKKQLFGLFLMRLFNLRKNPLADGMQGLICTELVARVLARVLNIHMNIDYDIVGLKAIYLTLIKETDKSTKA